MAQPTVDLNADCGESFGPWRMGADAELSNEAGESALEVSPPVIAVSAPVLGELMVRLRDLDGWLASGETTLTFSVAFPDRRHFTDCEHAGMDDVYYLNVVVRFASDGTVSETSFSEALLLGDE